MITSWADYITSEKVKEFKNSILSSKYNSSRAQFEELRLFDLFEYIEIFLEYGPSYSKKFFIWQKTDTGSIDLQLVFFNADFTVVEDGYYDKIKTVDGSKFLFIDPRDHTFISKRYTAESVSSLRTLNRDFARNIIEFYPIQQ